MVERSLEEGRCLHAVAAAAVAGAAIDPMIGVVDAAGAVDAAAGRRTVGERVEKLD